MSILFRSFSLQFDLDQMSYGNRACYNGLQGQAENNLL